MRAEKISEVKSWFQKAANDLRGAKIDLQASPPLIEDALFHCQQAAEKSMKGFLTFHDCIFRKTHDLDNLASLCETIDSRLTDILDASRDLTIFAWVFRYPGETGAPSVEEARNSLAIARKVFESILSRLPKEIRP